MKKKAISDNDYKDNIYSYSLLLDLLIHSNNTNIQLFICPKSKTGTERAREGEKPNHIHSTYGWIMLLQKISMY